MLSYFIRMAKLMLGLLLYALGSYLSIQANVGLAPWEAFSMGVSNVLPISMGDVLIYSGLAILVVDVILKEKIGVGTILNTLLIGKFIDWFRTIAFIPQLNNFFAGILLLLLGQVIMCIATYFYIGAGLGCGPRDALMVAIAHRANKLPIGVIRGMIEGGALLIGWVLGAKVGIGTIVAVFGISFLLQATFLLLRFNVKCIKHESIFDTFKAVIKLCSKKESLATNVDDDGESHK